MLIHTYTSFDYIPAPHSSGPIMPALPPPPLTSPRPRPILCLSYHDDTQKKDLTPLSLRAQASTLAATTMASQSQAFQRYGVWGDWATPYATLQPCYEAQQVRVFGEMVRKGYIYRGKKPVHWSPSSHTALAEAELEYPPAHVSTSVHVGFQVTASSPALATLQRGLDPSTASSRPLKIAIWTTTPWTLPANQVSTHTERERERDTQTHTHRERDTHTDKETQTQTHTDTHTDTHRQIHTLTHKYTIPYHTATEECRLIEKVRHTNECGLISFNCCPLLCSALLGGCVQAVAVNPSLVYSIVTHPQVQRGAYFLVAKDLIPEFAATITKSDLFTNSTGHPNEEEGEGGGLVFTECGDLSGAELVGTEYQHPVHAHQTQRVVVGGSYVTAESGTGLVHTAPGHGMDDFVTGQREQLEVVSPVDDYGRFTEEAGPGLAKRDVLKEGNSAVIEMLRASSGLLHVEDYPHKYPYDWRTGKPVITRTTEQWFASVEAFRDEVMAAIEGVQWVPAVGQKRISSMVTGRKDWCISRQRAWGVPIPVFYHVDTREVLMTAETIAHVEGVIRQQGSDAWWRLGVEELLPQGLRHLAGSYAKGSDTMDVWFDSGTSWAGVLQEREASRGCGEGQRMFPADMYLEGSDQHRGWFQSSLLTAVAAAGVAPYKTVLTHGFVLDEKGHKMSKSLGNVVDPDAIINGGKNKKMHPAYGADTLRLWVAGVDYTSDVSIGDGIIKQTSDTYRKLRNTLRFLLGSISDFNPATDTVPFERLPSLDKFMLGKLTETFASVDQAYTSYQFYKASNQINQFAVNQLSNFYLDISKDRLYISSPDDSRRRSCQTVLHHVFEQVVLMMAPLVPHMAEDAYQNLPHLPSEVSSSPPSVFERGWLQDQPNFTSHEPKRWEFMTDLRGDVNQCIELARRDKHIGASQECEVHLYIDEEAVPDAEEKLRDILAMTQEQDAFIAPSTKDKDKDEESGSGSVSDMISSVDDLRFILLVSQVRLASSMDQLTTHCADYSLPSECTKTGVSIGVRRAGGRKCNRCWYFSESVQDTSAEVVGAREDRRDVCSRCAHILMTT
jgi:isoleucyl-tRNA synthetase